MTEYFISLHVDRPTRFRLPVENSWSAAMREVTSRTESTFGTVMLGLKQGDDAGRCVFYGPLAHLRDRDGCLIEPDDPKDRLYQADGTPEPYAIRKWVRGMVLDAAGRRADDHAVWMVDREAFSRVEAFVEERSASPALYQTKQNNCVKFALAALEAGGIALPKEGLKKSVARLRYPENISESIQLIHPSPPAVQVYAEARLLG